jgi:DNA repair exonuclease SbcCD ATPase subunit
VGSDPGAANEELSEAVETASGARQKLGDGNLEQALDLQQRCFEELEAEIKKMANKLSDVQSQLEEASNEFKSIYRKEKEIKDSDFWVSLQNLEESIESGSNIGDIRSSLRDFIDGSDGPPNDAVRIKDVREEIKLLEELKGTVVHAENLISESRRIIEYSTQTLGEIAEEGSDDQEQRAESLLEKAQALNTELEDVESASETARGQLSDVATEESADAELLEENAERFVEAADSAEAIISSLEDLGLRTGAFLEASGSGFDVGEFLEQLQSLVPRLRENAEIRREEAKILEQNS